MRKAPQEYAPLVLDLVAQIGKLVKTDAALYRFDRSTQSWQYITADLVSTGWLNPSYNNVPTSGYGPYAVAAMGQGGNKQLHPVFTYFTMTPFSGSCALVISTGAQVPLEYQGRGINKLGIRLREAIAGVTGYTGLVCTDIANNARSIRTIEGAGFKKLYTLNNKRTKNNINIYIKEIE